MVDSRKDAKPPSVAASGRTRTVGGGISPERIFRATFSHISACAGTSARSSPSSDRPAVFSLSLWQDTQYVVVSFAYSAGGGCGFLSARDFGGALAPARARSTLSATREIGSLPTRASVRAGVRGWTQWPRFRR